MTRNHKSKPVNLTQRELDILQLLNAKPLKVKGYVQLDGSEKLRDEIHEMQKRGLVETAPYYLPRPVQDRWETWDDYEKRISHWMESITDALCKAKLTEYGKRALYTHRIREE